MSVGITYVYPQNTDMTSDTLLKFANIGLEKYLKLVKKDNVENYGFSSIEDLDSIKLGNPIQTLYFDYSFYKDSILKNDDYITPKEEYRIPLIVNDTICSFLIIAKFDNQLSIVGIGGNILAENIMQCMQKNKINNKNEIFLLREPLSQSDYLVSDYHGRTIEPAYFPVMTSTSCLNKQLPDRKMTKKEILPLIHQNYYSNKHMFKFNNHEKNN